MAYATSFLIKPVLVKVSLYVLLAVTIALASMYLFPIISGNRQERLQEMTGFKSEKQQYTYDIATVIRSVKSEIFKAQQMMVEASEPPLFQLEEFDLELNFVVRNQAKAGVQLKLPELFVLSDESSVAKERVQTIQLHFSVVKGKSFKSPVQPIPPDLDDVIKLAPR